MKSESLNELYKKEQYGLVIKYGYDAINPKNLKLVALSFMRLGRISEAMEVWKRLKDDPKEKKSSLFYLGVCHYAINEFMAAYAFFRLAIDAGFGERAEIWLKKTLKNIG